MKLFGFELKKSSSQEADEKIIKPVTAQDDVMAESDVVISGGRFGTPYEIDASRENEGQLINRYRSMLVHQEVDDAVTDVCNEAIVYNEDRQPVSIDLSMVKISDDVKNKISDAFEDVLDLLNFSSDGHDLFKRWYVDGRICYHISIDKDNPDRGILDMRRLDPRRLKKITKIEEDEDKETKAKYVKKIESIYTYDQSLQMKNGAATVNMTASPAMAGTSTGNIMLPKDSVLHVTSGLFDSKSNRVVGHLHKAVRPLNQLKMMEDSLVIYRFSRAPERRVFYIDVGALPSSKAAQYVREQMNKYRRKLIYDADSGTIDSDGKHMTITDDFWFPRREGGRGTEVTSLPGGQNLGDIEDVQYFKEKLYKSLNVPISRLQPENGMSLGRASEITRDEVKFARFVDVLRNKFAELFLQALRVQLVLTKVITLADWQKIRGKINFSFANDSFFTQLKEIDILQEQLRAVGDVKEYVGVYYSHQYVQKKILGMTDTEIIQMRKQIEAEKNDSFYSQNEDDRY